MKIKLINEPITSDYMKNLLRSRGIEDFEGFIHPSEENLQSFKDIDDIYTGVKLIAKAIAEKQRIALIVDCDVDGFTSSSILYQYLRRLAPDLIIDHYIHDGKQHGLEDMWEKLQNKNYGLILVPDAGSNDSKYADEIETPVLVIDHHILEDEVSSNYITLINNQTSKFYHNKNLSGAGMAYQFCRAMDEVFKKEWADDYIDLAALGVCADMMSGLEIENQYLWKKGFSKVNNYFFLTVARKQAYSITGKINATDAEIFEALNPTSVAFYIVPMINAMIRIGTEAEKERLFIAFVDGHRLVPSNKRGAKGTMEEVAIESTRECTNARNHQNKRRDEVMERLEQKIFKHDLLENEVLFIRLDEDDDFPSVLNGLVAMQLSAKYKKPTIVARLNDEGYIRGSARGLNASELTSFKDFLNSTGLFEYTAG
jgi:single-stranded-DNA-specific exonuclease